MLINIYCLKRSDTDEVFYVGQTEKTLEFRLAQHICSKYNKERRRIIEELLTNGCRPLIELLEAINEEKANDCERKWIAHFFYAGSKLTNLQFSPQSELSDKIISFFKDRPSISIGGIEREANIPQTSLSQAISGTRKLTLASANKLAAVLEIYGFGNPDCDV